MPKDVRRSKTKFIALHGAALRGCKAAWLFCVAAIAFIEISAQACSIPVFRYALDRWRADSFALEIPAPIKDDEKVSSFIRNLSDSSPVNLQLTVPRDRVQSPPRLRFPNTPSEAPGVWEGVLNADSLGRLTNSPARQEIAKRIVNGESAVWVLVEKGGSAANDALAARIEKRLRYLESVAQLPYIDPNDPTSKLGAGPPLQIKFSLIRIAEDNLAEGPFIRMLAGPKPDTYLDQTSWVAAVFGRGRVLGSWATEGFGDEQIDEVCLFLLGACSCRVKDLNPGWDVLMSVNWDDELTKVAEANAGKAPAVLAPTAAKPDPTLKHQSMASVKETAGSHSSSAAPPNHDAKPETNSISAPIVTATVSNGDAIPHAEPHDNRLAYILGGVFTLLAAGIVWFKSQAK